MSSTVRQLYSLNINRHLQTTEALSQAGCVLSYIADVYVATTVDCTLDNRTIRRLELSLPQTYNYSN